MRYSELFEHVYGPRSRPSPSGKPEVPEADRRPWAVLRMLLGRKGFEYWWNGVTPETQDEIFEELRALIASRKGS